MSSNQQTNVPSLILFCLRRLLHRMDHILTERLGCTALPLLSRATEITSSHILDQYPCGNSSSRSHGKVILGKYLIYL